MWHYQEDYCAITPRYLSALLLISLVNAVNAAGVEDVLPENVNICFKQIYPKYVCCKDIIDKHVNCLNNRRKRTIRKKRRRRGTWRAVSPPGWFPWHCRPLPPGQQVVGENTKWNQHKYKKEFRKTLFHDCRIFRLGWKIGQKGNEGVSLPVTVSLILGYSPKLTRP